MIGGFKLQLWMWLVDLHYNFECDWLIALSVNKLSHNNLASELVEKFFIPIIIEEIVIFIIGQKNVVLCSEGNIYGYDEEKLSVDHFWEFEG